MKLIYLLRQIFHSMKKTKLTYKSFEKKYLTSKSEVVNNWFQNSRWFRNWWRLYCVYRMELRRLKEVLLIETESRQQIGIDWRRILLITWWWSDRPKDVSSMIFQWSRLLSRKNKRERWIVILTFDLKIFRAKIWYNINQKNLKKC